MTPSCYAHAAGEAIEGGFHDITPPVPGTMASRADTGRLRGYKVLDASGQSLAYIYARETRDQADIAKVFTLRTAILLYWQYPPTP